MRADLLAVRWLWVIAAAVMLAVACGADEEAGTSSTTIEPETVTSGPRSTTTRPEATTAQTVPGGTEAAPSQTVSVYFGAGDGSDCAEVAEYRRGVASEADPIRAAFEQLVGGPTAVEVDLGAGSFFSPATAGAVRATTLDGGQLVVDFDDIRSLLSNASTSCGSEALLSELNSTAFQFDEVDRVRYTIEGSCDRFMNWLQRECVEFDRSGQRSVPTSERAEGSNPGSG